MKTILLLGGIFLLIALAHTQTTSNDIESHAQSVQSQQRVCLKRVKNNCTPKRSVCTRIGRSNLCRRFKTNCLYRRANCKQSAQAFTTVDISLCRGIKGNQEKACNSSGSSSGTGTGTSTGTGTAG